MGSPYSEALLDSCWPRTAHAAVLGRRQRPSAPCRVAPENVLHNRDRRGQRATHAKKPQPFEQTRGPVGSSWVLPCAVSISALCVGFRVTLVLPAALEAILQEDRNVARTT